MTFFTFALHLIYTASTRRSARNTSNTEWKWNSTRSVFL